MNEQVPEAGAIAPEDPVASTAKRRGAACCPIHSGKPRVVWFWAVLLAIGWHGFWGWFFSPADAIPGAAPARTPQVSYMPVHADGRDGEALSADIRALWSPVLFSIPTPMGFSRSVLTNEAGVRPPLGQPMMFSNFLERGASSISASPLVTLPPLTDMVAQAVNSLTPAGAGPSPIDVGPATAEEVRIEFLQGLARTPPANLKLPRHPWINGDKAWEMVLYIEFDEEGIVRQVFAESPTESDTLNAAIVQAAWKLRLEPSEGPAVGRIVIRNRGRALLTDGRQNGGGP